jgi:nitroimidazol reductase NimA-like FMN-containing flavoprotein (pyridoxamine 5'-phosphate oxidase superfamily)
MTELSQLRRHPERLVADQRTEILAGGLVAHVGFCKKEQPFVIPFSYHFDVSEPDKIYLHGAPSSRALLHIEVPVRQSA